MLFVEKAGGTTFHKLPPQVRSAVGPLIVDSSLTLLLRQGWFDADRHAGNQLIDADRRVIHPLDFGLLGLDWEKYIQHDTRYERPAEVDLLIGDPAKARQQLGWEPKVKFKELVKLMVDHDLDLAKREAQIAALPKP